MPPRTSPTQLNESITRAARHGATKGNRGDRAQQQSNKDPARSDKGWPHGGNLSPTSNSLVACDSSNTAQVSQGNNDASGWGLLMIPQASRAFATRELAHRSPTRRTLTGDPAFAAPPGHKRRSRVDKDNHELGHRVPRHKLSETIYHIRRPTIPAISERVCHQRRLRLQPPSVDPPTADEAITRQVLGIFLMATKQNPNLIMIPLFGAT